MANNETISPLEAMSAAVRAATKLSNENETSEKLTPNMLAAAIKLATLSSDKQAQLTPANVNAAIKVAKTSSNQEEQHDNLTPESLAMALKSATKLSSNSNDNNDDDKDTSDTSAHEMFAAMKAAIAMTQKSQSDDLATTEILSDALELSKK